MIKAVPEQRNTLPMQALPGFRDFLPDDCARRNYIFARWREVARRYGFVEWEGPPLEAIELYKKKSGAEIVDPPAPVHVAVATYVPAMVGEKLRLPLIGPFESEPPPFGPV